MIVTAHETNRQLHRAGIPVVDSTVVDSAQAAKAGAHNFGYPVALKFSSAKFTHKTEVGGIHLGLQDDEQVAAAFGKLRDLRERNDPEGQIVLEPMAPQGAELFIGVQDHPQFGLVMSVGLGGIWLELIPDVSFRLLPASSADFWGMLGELKSWPKLESGFRHLPPVDGDRFLRLLDQVAKFALERGDLKELDLNPVIAGVDGPLVVDATLVLKEEE